MGNVGSRQGEGDPLFLRDQNRFSISALTVTNSRNRVLLNITPNAFPATRYTAKRDFGDDSVVDYVQDPESSPASPPSFLLRLSNDEELFFNFTFVVRQSQALQTASNPAIPVSTLAPVDTVINGLTFVFAPSSKELDNLVTREFHADPNLHKNPNVELVGDYSTVGNQSVQFQWSWKWRPPRPLEDRGGGWRNSCSFVEYDPRAHRLDTLASFAFWVQNTQKVAPLSPKTPSPHLELSVPPRLRVPSAQSIDSRFSDSDGAEFKDAREPSSPMIEAIPEHNLGLVPTHATYQSNALSLSTTNNTLNAVKVDLSCQRPAEDISALDDGPVFRANLKNFEKNTADMRSKWKRVLKKAEAALEAQVMSNNAVAELIEALKDTATPSSNSVQPAIDHYFDKIAREILAYEKLNTINVQKLIIDPISKLYNVDIKQAESKKKDFEEESKEYYSYVSRYLGQRQDSMKEKRRTETDTKYQTKRRNFELKRFDYSSYIQDLNGGRKNQEVLSYLTKYADAQAKGFMAASDKVKSMLPQLEALTQEVKEADKEFQLQRAEREEKRRALEKSGTAYKEPEVTTMSTLAQANGSSGLSELSRSDSIAPTFKSTVSPPPTTVGSPPSTAVMPVTPGLTGGPPGGSLPGGSPSQNKFKGIRDLEDKAGTDGQDAHPPHKEGLLWALSRPGSHIDPKGLNKQAWHKFWITVGEGKLSEYSDWKNKMNLHMTPIDLRVASVREARNSERRFCFEVITPQFTRVYQTTGEDELRTWINAINNALQTAVESKGINDPASKESLDKSTRRDIASVLTGKSTSLSGRGNTGNTSKDKPVSRHATVGDRPSYRNPEPSGEATKLLEQIREADAGNKYCADCGSESKVDWVSINLGIVVCIECSGIHRSLGTHISKVRSLTLDVHSFTQDIIELLFKIGNRVSNMIWEAKLDRSLKPTPTSTREQRLRFINQKYAERAFVQQISPTLSHYATPDETLLASVKKNDIQNVLYALSLKANPNSTDKSRSTPAVYLALSAADPASPADTTSPASSPGHAAQGTPAGGRKPFPVAELLIQNGADLPSTPPPFPLSLSARLYLEQKDDQLNGRRPGASNQNGNNASSSSGGDMLTALPTIMAGNGSSPGERNKERDAKLQKRVSAGGRLMKSDESYSSRRMF
ncbi:Arf GTPase activating protein [Macrophomina phaseolina MS6]|uniref:ADP-ribosylation factor GTPase-activating protein n=1 Tax=Macrophomina phaseolina (strain MS6) TaxID=1126212 RepID=K2QXI4_MACPH|nr:Arf GTPase activating protein [Macrophomina phaseolina MS6]